MVLSGMLYNRGCEIPAKVLMATLNFAALVENRRVMQVPRNRVNAAVKAIPVNVEQQPEFSMERCAIIAEPCGDAVKQWQESVRLTACTCGGSIAMAKDLLCGDREGARLFQLATRIESERVAVDSRNFGRRPAVSV
jgi:hypothetical protein